MNLYLDEDSAKALLATLLRKAGHQVTLPISVGLSGADDPEHFLHAVGQSLILLTRNHDDFRVLHLHEKIDCIALARLHTRSYRVPTSKSIVLRSRLMHTRTPARHSHFNQLCISMLDGLRSKK